MLNHDKEKRKIKLERVGGNEGGDVEIERDVRDVMVQDEYTAAVTATKAQITQGVEKLSHADTLSSSTNTHLSITHITLTQTYTHTYLTRNAGNTQLQSVLSPSPLHYETGAPI